MARSTKPSLADLLTAAYFNGYDYAKGAFDADDRLTDYGDRFEGESDEDVAYYMSQGNVTPYPGRTGLEPDDWGEYLTGTNELYIGQTEFSSDEVCEVLNVDESECENILSQLRDQFNVGYYAKATEIVKEWRHEAQE